MRTIKLKSNGLGRYDDVSPFLVESGELELEIKTPALSGEFFFVGEMNGEVQKAIPVRDGKVTLTFLRAGELRAEVKHYLRGELIESYKVEPLLIKAVDTSLSATPEISLLTGEVKALRERTKALQNAREGDNAATKKAFAGLAKAFLAFAYAEYENDVQLNARGRSFEEFAEALGLPTDGLSEEEIEEIKNLKEKL